LEHLQPDPQILIELGSTKMPYGKYKEILICDPPIHYLEWINRNGFPKGKLGMLLATIYEIKLNGIKLDLKGIAARYKTR
jgi:uncharacterized protein (DUF3820 family)